VVWRLQDQSELSGTITFIDLAGSERIVKNLTQGYKYQEQILISSNLLELGKWLQVLHLGSQTQVPVAESEPVRSLKSSVDSRSQVWFIANLNEVESNMEECLNTLQFAERIKKARLFSAEKRLESGSKLGLGLERKEVKEEVGNEVLKGQAKRLEEENADLRIRLELVAKEQKQKFQVIAQLLGLEFDIE